MKKAIQIIVFIFLSINAMAQDSLTFKNRFVQTTYIGVPLFVAGFTVKGEKEHFRALRNDFVPNYHNEIDNYLQYAPAVLPIALKACGVESQSSWGKMMTAEATSIAFVTLFAQGIKRTAHELRPDGTNRHSFPSGHTASAFMSATILSKEYGHYSPWVSIGAYSTATATGVMRMLNNRHWMSDVLSGAGIGIVSAELAYWVSDLLFPNEPKSSNPKKLHITTAERNPSFLGAYAGITLPINDLAVAKNKTCNATTGGTVGLEGAWYFSKNFGLGGRLAFSNITIGSEYSEFSESSESSGNSEYSQSSPFSSLQVGAYANLPFAQRLFIEGKMLAGAVHYSSVSTPDFTLPKRTSAMATTGLSIGVRANNVLDIKTTIDYSVLSQNTPSTQKSQTSHLLTLSTTANFRF